MLEVLWYSGSEYCKPTFIRERENFASFTRTLPSRIFLVANQIFFIQFPKNEEGSIAKISPSVVLQHRLACHTMRLSWGIVRLGPRHPLSDHTSSRRLNSDENGTRGPEATSLTWVILANNSHINTCKVTFFIRSLCKFWTFFVSVVFWRDFQRFSPLMQM
jgi:hypothetical protein